jgi:CHASE2 domain-containing sensor protein
MLRFIRKIFNSNFQVQNTDIFAGIIAIGVIITIRLLGGFQFLELYAFDRFMPLHPLENPDERILIVGIDEDDIRASNRYPIPDEKLALLLENLQAHKPVAIGLDIFRDLPVPPGRDKLFKAYKKTDNFIAIEKILPDISGHIVKPPPGLTSEQLGFADAVLDKDGKQRRAFLASSNLDDEWRLSLALKLARKYLAEKGLSLDNVDGDEYGMKFGSTILERFLSNSGGYVCADDGGNQVLINFRNHPKPFDIVSLEEVINKRVSPDRIRNKIVLIGMTSPSAKDYIYSQAIQPKDDNKQAYIYGVEVQAHIVSQIISAVEDGRPMIKVWSDAGEYLWIIVLGFAGIILGRSIQSPLKLVLTVATISLNIIAASYILFIFGWWIPIIPSIIMLLLNGMVIAVFSKYDKALKSRIQDRQIIIDQAFEAIHGGPLQNLSMILRYIKDDNTSLDRPKLSSDLTNLNQELRQLRELLHQEVSLTNENFNLGTEGELDLEQPLHENFYLIYFDILEKNLPEFKTLKSQNPDFQELDERNLSIQQKRGLCRFLEEGITNAGKYAKGITRLDIICKQERGHNVIRIIDDGCGIQQSNSSHQGFGTKQAHNLARQLKGKFQRFPNYPKGTVFQLTWSARKLGFWLF